MNIIISSLNGGRGSGTIVTQQAQALLDKGHNISYVSTTLPPGHAPLPKDTWFHPVGLNGKPVPIHECLPNTDRPTMHAAKIHDPSLIDEYVRDYEAGLRIAASIMPTDLIISHHANLNTIAAKNVAEELSIPFVSHVHGTCIRGYQENGAMQAFKEGDLSGNGYTWKSIKDALQRSSRILAISRFVGDELIAPNLDLAARNKITVISNFVDPFTFDHPNNEVLERFVDEKGLPLGPDGKVKKGILYLGAMTERKGAHAVAGMGPMLEDLDVPVYLMGSGDGEKLASDNPNVYYLGAPTNEEKVAIFTSAGIIGITPNLSVEGEDFGLVHKEFALAGIPTLAPANGVYVEHIIDGFNGFLIPPLQQTPEGLATKVREIFETNEASLNLIGMNAREMVVSNFGRERTIDRFVTTVEGIGSRSVEGGNTRFYYR